MNIWSFMAPPSLAARLGSVPSNLSGEDRVGVDAPP